jgi:3-dehydro-4-phosphotetronate decarboxylase
MATETQIRDEIVATGLALYSRGLTHGSTGNISVRLADGGWLMTPTGSSLGTLDPARLSRFDPSGRHVGGDAPTKEAKLHMAVYGERQRAGAVVHLHSHHSVALSVLPVADPHDMLPPITAYAVMRLGALALAPYFPPGDARLAEAVRTLAGKHHAILLANHGPVVAGLSLSAATDAVEELEATARLVLDLEGRTPRLLTPAEVAEIRAKFPIPF